jgi:segregation and condensation protein B
MSKPRKHDKPAEDAAVETTAENIAAAADAPADPVAVEMQAEAAVVAEDQTSVAVVDVETNAPVSDAAPAPEAYSPNPTPHNDPTLLRRVLEGLLFITDRPLSAGELAKLVNVRDQDRIVECVEELRRDLEARDLGYRLIAVAEGWQMATRPELAPYMRKLFSDRATMRLSTAAQETLSIISYKQPLTRAEIEEIRGVEVIAALETLLEKRLVKVVGRRETVGRPLMYGTTMEFLRHFGLRTLEDLPPIDSFGPSDAPAPSAPAEAEGPFAAAQPEAEYAPPIEEAAASEPSPSDALRAVAEAVEAPVEPQDAESAPQDKPAEPLEPGEDESLWPK